MTTEDRSRQVVAIVVAYNRAELLAECLSALAAQSVPLQGVIVVDNHSTDQSLQVAQEHPVVTQVVSLGQNTGGAGGFTAGIAYALAGKNLREQDFLWIMDDDTIPAPTALAELLQVAADYPGSPALLASAAHWTDGSIHPMNTHRQRPGLNRSSLARAKAIGTIPIRAASFVSILLEVGQVRRVGLPIADYFLWNDDLEYTARLLKNRVGLYVPSSRVLHKTKALASATDDPGERFYYEVRNKLWFLTRSRGLRINDRVLYAGATVVRWSKMFVLTKHRLQMFRLLLKGLLDGVLSRPRPNREIFEFDPQTAQVVQACEEIVKVARSAYWPGTV